MSRSGKMVCSLNIVKIYYFFQTNLTKQKFLNYNPPKHRFFFNITNVAELQSAKVIAHNKSIINC
jgi:hypothetical protein